MEVQEYEGRKTGKGLAFHQEGALEHPPVSIPKIQTEAHFFCFLFLKESQWLSLALSFPVTSEEGFLDNPSLLLRAQVG